jgi:hypothetical protein
MPLLEPRPVARRFSLRELVVWLAIASLAVALAQRTFHVSSTATSAVQSSARGAKVQQLADDAHHWALPPAGLLLLLSSVASPRIASEQQLRLSPNRNGWICDRPPPVC